jgi:flagellar protein FliO/FliZ
MRLIAVAVFLCSPAIAYAASPKGNEGGSMAVAVLQMTASLAVVIGIIYLLYYISNRWFKGIGGGKADPGHIRVVETRYLAPKKSLMIIEVAGEYLLLDNGSEGMRLIKKLENGNEFAAYNNAVPHQPIPEVFRKKIDSMMEKARDGFHNVIESNFVIKTVFPIKEGERK